MVGLGPGPLGLGCPKISQQVNIKKGLQRGKTLNKVLNAEFVTCSVHGVLGHIGLPNYWYMISLCMTKTKIRFVNKAY